MDMDKNPRTTGTRPRARLRSNAEAWLNEQIGYRVKQRWSFFLFHMALCQTLYFCFTEAELLIYY